MTAERPEDAAEIEALLDLAFGHDRFAKVSYRYRRGVPPVPYLRFVIRDAGRPAGKLLGTIRYWPLAIGPRAVPALLLGPIAVAPETRGTGVGATLMRRSLDRAAAAGHAIVVLVGDVAYYGRFGFRPAAPHGLAMPDEAPARVLVTELRRGALDGVSGIIERGRPMAEAVAEAGHISVSPQRAPMLDRPPVRPTARTA